MQCAVELSVTHIESESEMSWRRARVWAGWPGETDTVPEKEE